MLSSATGTFGNSEYSSSWSGSATTVPMSVNGGTDTWGEGALYLEPFVTQPLTLTTGDGGTFGTFAIAGCGVSNSSVISDGYTKTYTGLTPSCAVTLTAPADGATTRYRFPGPSTTFTFDTCSANLCPNEAVTVYYQDYDAVSYSVTGGGSGYSAPTLTCYQAGSSGSCGTLSVSPTSVWMDYGSTWSATNPLTGSGSSERWDSGTASGTVGSSVIVVPYYHQFNATFAYAVSGGGSPTAPTLNYTHYGSTASTPLTITPTAYWADSGGSYMVYPNPLTGSGSTERWETPGTATSGIVTSATATTFTYYHQFAQTVSYTLLGGGTFTAPSLNYTYLGTAGTLSTMNPTGSKVWVDDGSSWTSTDPLGGSGSSQRAYSGGASGTASSSGTIAPAYYNQLSILFSYSVDDSAATSHPTFTIDQLGSPQVETNSKTATAYWVDSNSPWTAQTPWTTSPDLKTFYGAPAAGQAATGTPVIVVYGASSAGTCVGSNPLTVFEANPTGCFVPFVFAVWDANTGPLVYFSFLLLGVNVMIYNKTQSIVISLVVMLAMGATFGYLLPSTVQLVANVFLYLGIAGITFRLVTALRS